MALQIKTIPTKDFFNEELRAARYFAKEYYRNK